MVTVSIAVEGASDVPAAEKILASRSITVDQRRIFVTRGKHNFDKKIGSYNNAAENSPWFVLRDSDRDGSDCPATLREMLLPADRQAPGLCFRLAGRALEAWLMADSETFARTFSVARSVIPTNAEELPDPKEALINVCRKSRSSEVRKAMVPPVGSTGRVGPEYVARISDYARDAWRPDVAATAAPSLARALREIDNLLLTGVWR
ncbi:hypothetical protein AB0E63_22720 [Kribbella sp. NPDC026596]|uniref:hypothetical protein n=1 Tax=Kribbella sp. NPDC026596 TaxID=3155122 RepID=UPI00340523FE